MSRARNAVIIIILCIIGAYTVKKGPELGLTLPTAQDIKDAVAGGPSRRGGSGIGSPKLTLGNGTGEELRDAVAGHAVGTPNNGTNSLAEIDAPPRGNGLGGFSPFAQNNNVPPSNPPSLSPSGPSDVNP